MTRILISIHTSADIYYLYNLPLNDLSSLYPFHITFYSIDLLAVSSLEFHRCLLTNLTIDDLYIYIYKSSMFVLCFFFFFYSTPSLAFDVVASLLTEERLKRIIN